MQALLIIYYIYNSDSCFQTREDIKDTKVRMTSRKQQLGWESMFVSPTLFSNHRKYQKLQKRTKQILNDNAQISSRGTGDCQTVT